MSLITYIIIVVALSAFTFISYYMDKDRAKKGQWRIPRKSLIMSGFLFGSLGGLLANLILGYKEKKLIILNVIALFCHTLIGVFVYLNFGL